MSSWDAAKEGLDLPTRRSEADRTEQWQGFFTEGLGTMVVAEVDDSVVGFIAWGPSRDHDRQGEREVYTLYVDPEHWGEGVGAALLGCVPIDQTVSLWVAEGNVRARGFYGRRGFTPDGASEPGHHVPAIRVARPGA